MADDDLSINFDGKAYALDEFELGDLEWLEDFIGRSLDGDAIRSMKAAVGFVYLIKRRDDPNFTVEQARKMKLTAFEAPAPPEPAKRPTRPRTR